MNVLGDDERQFIVIPNVFVNTAMAFCRKILVEIVPTPVGWDQTDAVQLFKFHTSDDASGMRLIVKNP